MKLEKDDLEKCAKLAEKVLYWYFFDRKESPLRPFKKYFKNVKFKVILEKRTNNSG